MQKNRYFVWVILVVILFVGLLYFLIRGNLVEKVLTAKKNISHTVAFIDHTQTLKENLGKQADLGKIPIYTPVEFAIKEDKAIIEQYNYNEGYYYVIVKDEEGKAERRFESFAVNADYKTPLLPALPASNHNIRIKFYLEKQQPHTIKLFHSSNDEEILSCKLAGTATKHHGPLHFSEINNHFLVHDDGTAFFGIAHNFSYEGDPSADIIMPFEIEKSLRRYLPQGESNPVNSKGSHIVGNVLKKFKEQGGNLIQIYLEYHTFQIDNSVLGDYRLEEDRMRALEEIFKFCYENDIYIQLAITDHNDVVEWHNPHFCRTATCDTAKGGSDPNPYKQYVDEHPLVVEGHLGDGNVNTYKFPNCRMMYYVHPDVRAFVKNKFRYIVARFGHYPNLFAFSVFSEQETLGDDDARNITGNRKNLKLASDTSRYVIEKKDYNDLGLYHHQDGGSDTRFWGTPAKSKGEIPFNRVKDIVTNWVLEMADYVHGLDNKLLVAAGGGMWVNDSMLYQNPQRLDFVSTHVYDRPPTRNSLFVNNVQLRASAAGKPFLRGEGGTQSGQSNADLSRINIHNSLWASAFCGSFSTYMEWYWQQSTFNEVSWMQPQINKPRNYYKPIATFFADEEMHKYNWIPMSPYFKKHISEWTAWEPYQPNEDYFNYYKNPQAATPNFQIDEELKKRMNWTNKTQYSPFYDASPPVLGTPCVDYSPEFFIFRCFNFDGSNIRLKGQYPKEEQIRISIKGDLNHINCSDVEVYALKSKEKILGWVHHKESYWLNHEGFTQDERDPNTSVCASPPGSLHDMKNQIFSLSGVKMHIPFPTAEGNYQVQWYSSYKVKEDGKLLPIGKPSIVKAINGMLVVDVPELRVDNDFKNTENPDADYAFKIIQIK